MRITLRWGKSREYQPFPLHGGGGVRAFRVDRLRHHAAQFDDSAGEVRPLLLRPLRGWGFCRGLGDGADPAVAGAQFAFRFSRFAFFLSFVTALHGNPEPPRTRSITKTF